MTGPLRAAVPGSAPEDRCCLDLKHLYLEELRRILASEKPRAWPRGIQWIIDYTETHPVGVHRPDGHRTWVWSDLHLRHANLIKHCKRPFANARDMDRTMLTVWKFVVGTDDTVLNGGAVALAGSLGESGRARIREAPGRKILVVGNHDFNRRTGAPGRRRPRRRDRNPVDRGRSFGHAAGQEALPEREQALERERSVACIAAPQRR